MLIDWFTVGAQMLNFVLLLCLLKRFLYKPILSAMEKRENMIADNLQQAALAKAAAEAEELLFKAKNRDFELQQDSRLKLAKERAEQEYQQALTAARRQVEEQQQQWKAVLATQQSEFYERLKQEVQREAFALTERVLTDLADAKLEEQMLTVLLQQLTAAAVDSSRFTTDHAVEITVHSSFDLSAASRTKLTTAFRQIGLPEAAVVFSRREELLCGWEIILCGQKYSWSIKEYLKELQEQAKDFLEGKNERHDLGT